MAINLKNFTLNTNFPAIAKTISANRTCTLTSQTVGSGQMVSASVYVSVGSGEICETLLNVGTEYIPYTRHYVYINGAVVYEYVTERVSATQVQFTIACTNNGVSAITIPTTTASVLVSAFKVP